MLKVQRLIFQNVHKTQEMLKVLKVSPNYGQYMPIVGEKPLTPLAPLTFPGFYALFEKQPRKSLAFPGFRHQKTVIFNISLVSVTKKKVETQEMLKVVVVKKHNL